MTAARAHILLLALAALALLPAAAPAAQPKGPPNALQGFAQNHDEPVHIEAKTLEVRDKDKVATFSGDVHVRQGDTNMRCNSLVVFYEQDEKNGKSGTLPAADPGPGGKQRIKRLEARGHVVVTQKKETVTGDLGIFDMKTNTVTVTGKVVMTDGKNILRGGRLVVDLTNGVSKVESGKNGHGRVQGLFMPGKGSPGAPPNAFLGKHKPSRPLNAPRQLH
jgi:lipopolysaccharide export system protein LptA